MATDKKQGQEQTDLAEGEEQTVDESIRIHEEKGDLKTESKKEKK